MCYFHYLSLSVIFVGFNLPFQLYAASIAEQVNQVDQQDFCWGTSVAADDVSNTELESFSNIILRYKNLNFIRVNTGISYSCGLTKDGQGYCWGQNFNGCLGTGDENSNASPTPIAGGHIFVAIAVNRFDIFHG